MATERDVDVPRRALRAAVEAAEPPTDSEVAKELADSDVWDGDDGAAFRAVDAALDDGVLVERDTGGMFPKVALADDGDSGDSDLESTGDAGSSRSNPRGCDDASASGDGLPDFSTLFDHAQERAGVDWWEPVPESALEDVLEKHGLASLLDDGRIQRMNRWKWGDLSARDEDPDRRYYYARGDEPRVEEFRRFHDLLMAKAPEGYTPHYFRVERAGKAPATQFGSWKTDEARLTVGEAVEWLRKGGNIGLGGRPDDPLVNIDIDDDEETEPGDLPPTLRARSRSRGGWHGWGFDDEGEIPNIPTDDAGEVRTDWQYVVAPGSFVASAAEEIPDNRLDDDPGYYTVEADDPVARIGYDDLPAVFREHDTDDEPDHDPDPTDGAVTSGGEGDEGEDYRTRSAVVDVTARDVVDSEGGDTDAAARWTALFHGSETSANMSLSDEGRIQCWRHNVAHGGLQALAVLSDESPEGCKAIGSGHNRSGVGPCQYAGDWRLLWWAWHYAKGEGYVPAADPIPYRALVGIALADGVVDRDALLYRCGADDCSATFDDREAASEHDCPESDGSPSVYRALPDADAYNTALEHVREEYDVAPGRDPVEGRADVPFHPDETPPQERDVTTDPAVAHRAAWATTPADLDDPLGVATLDGDDPDGWRCPGCGEPIGVVRAVAIDTGDVADCRDVLNDRTYRRAYDRARRDHGAPLPRYVDSEATIDRWHTAVGAVKELHAADIRDAMRSELTVDDPGPDREVARYDPAWRESESGESLIELDGGAFWDWDSKRALFPIQVVALETGVIDDPDEWDGDALAAAYPRAREEYGAPLPEWDRADADAPTNVAILPDPDDVLGEFTTDADRLRYTREEEVEPLLADAIHDADARRNRRAHLVRVLPALGKTTGFIKQVAGAAGDDTRRAGAYFCRRHELMVQAAETAEEWGATYAHLPVFAEARPADDALDHAVELVESDPSLLEEPDALAERVPVAVFPDDPDDDGACPDCGESFDTLTAARTHDCPVGDDETATPDRASCPTANGEHGAGWALAVHAARRLFGYQPRTLHNRARSIFGQPLPCCDGHDHGEAEGCAYAEAWDRLTDPERPVDLLIGHYAHANVAAATTEFYRNDERTEVAPRAVAIDEFPGESYAREYGREGVAAARWLADALAADVDVPDRTALLDERAGLWDDERVRAWLDGDVDGDDGWPAAAAARDVLADVLPFIKAREAADDLLDDAPRGEHFRRMRAALARVVLADVDDATTARDAVADALDAHTDDREGMSGWPDDVHRRVAEPLREFDGDGDLAARLADCPRPGGDALAGLVDAAIAAVREGRDSARGLVETARDALDGGEEGTQALAAAADDTDAHTDAHTLLYAVLAPDGDDGPAVSLDAESQAGRFAFGDDTDAVDRAKRVRWGTYNQTVLLDRDLDGAAVMDPPTFESATGDACPVLGLDATGRSGLWERAIGREVDVRDVHESAAEKRAFLRDVLNLQVIQTSDRVLGRSGPPSGGGDADVALVEAVAERYSGAQLRANTLTATSGVGVITTKKWQRHLGARLSAHAGDVAHYGDITGSNALGEHNVGCVLGSRHFGDGFAERWALYAGEEIDREGHGGTLDYNSEAANTALRHMREDETMQAVLRFGRDEEGAVVFVHTSAIADELPVVGDGEVVRAFSPTAEAVAEAAPADGTEFKVGDLADDVDRSRESIRRALEEFRRLGYADREKAGPGLADTHRLDADPGRRHKPELPDVGDAGGAATAGATIRESDPPQDDTTVVYTWSVGVRNADSGLAARSAAASMGLPAPTPASEAVPPG